MSDWVVYARKAPRKMRQRFHVVIASKANGQTVFTSENYVNPAHAVEIGQRFAALLDGNFVNLT